MSTSVAGPRLVTLGGLTLRLPTGDDDELAKRRRKLALLTLLALSPRPLSRELLADYFWGDGDEERARHSLSDALSHLRRVLGRDAVAARAADVSLTPGYLTVDAAEFVAACDRGESARAVALYGGAFLEGVFVDRAPRFEEWALRERGALRRRFTRACETECHALMRRRAYDTCAALARRWLDAAPDSTAGAAFLLNALKAPGTREALRDTLAAYDWLARRLRTDYGAEPSPELRALVEGATGALQTLVDRPAPRAMPADEPATRPVAPRPTPVPRPRLLAVAALLVAALGAGGAAWRRALDPTPDRRRIVVAPLENLTGDSSLANVGRLAADWFTQGLALTESVSVVSSAAVAMTLGDGRLPYAEQVRRLATATGAALLVSGSVVKRGDSLQLQVQVADARTGRLVRALDPAAGPARDPSAAIDSLRERLLGALVSEDWRGTVPVAYRPPRYSAYQEFLRGRDRFLRFHDSRGARPAFRRAIELDSTFVLAWEYLAATYSNVAEYDSVAAVVRRLEALDDRIAPAERDGLAWLQALLRGDREAQLRAQQALAARDSSPTALSLVGRHANELLRPRVAIPALERVDSAALALGWAPQVVELARAYHQAGQHERELATAERGRRLFPAYRLVVASELAALGALRRGAAGAALADSLLRGVTDPSGAQASDVVTAALELRAHGDTATGGRLLRMVIAWNRAHPTAEPAPRRTLHLGRAFLYLGQPDSAKAYLERVPRSASLVDATALLAVIRYRRTGDRAAALRIADALGAVRERWLFGQPAYARATILAAVGDREGATRLLRDALEQGFAPFDLHFEPGLDPLRGYPPFDALVTPQR